MPRCDNNESRWDEDEEIPVDNSWLEPYWTKWERMRHQAERDLNPDPLPGYGLVDNSDIEPEEQQERTHSYGYYFSDYTKIKR